MALITGLFAALYLWLRGRFSRILGWLLAALLWTGNETYRSEIFVLNFGWLGQGHGVVNCPALAAGASVLGCYGLSLMIVGLASLLATASRQNARTKVAAGAATILWLVLYFVPLPRPSPSSRSSCDSCRLTRTTNTASQSSEDEAELFLVPNDDPPEWGAVQRRQHRLLFQMRAVECGRWLARADVAGGTSIAAPNGQEAARIRTTGPGELTSKVGRLTGKTLFVRGGWIFGRVCLALSVTLAVATWVGAYKDRNGSGRLPGIATDRQPFV